MIKKLMLLRESYHIALFSLFVFMPIFLSIDAENGLAFNRMVSDNYAWKATIPISIIFTLVFLAFNSFKVVKNISKNSLLFLVYLCFSILVIYFSGNNGVDLSSIKTAIFMSMFICFFYGFKYYFSKKLSHSFEWKHAENRYILYPLILVLLMTLLSHFFIKAVPYGTAVGAVEVITEVTSTTEVTPITEVTPTTEVTSTTEVTPITEGSAFLMSDVTIYNFEQYFVFVFILLLASATRLKFAYFFTMSVASLYLALVTQNKSALIMMIALLIYYSISKAITPNLNDLFYKASKVLMIIFPVLYLLAMLLFVDVDILGAGLSSRHNYIQEYFSSLQWYQAFLPISDQVRTIVSDMHNEMLEVFNASALLGLIAYYYFIYRQIKCFSSRYKIQSISLFLLIFVGSTVTGNTTHMYLLVALTYYLAFYVAASCRERETNE
jgi:hypothetical protein